nr:hypothetical protein [Tanacetum cinerariifolium]
AISQGTRENTFNGSAHEDMNEHIEKVLEIVDLFHIPEVTQDQVMLRVFPMSLTGVEVILFYNGLDVPTRQIVDSKGVVPTKTTAYAKIAIQEMAEYSQKWNNETSSKTRSIETFDGLAAIQAQLNNLEREIKKVKEKVIIKQPRGIAENVQVRIGKFIFLIDFIILDIPEDDDVPLILGQPFLSTAHSKIDVYKRKFTLSLGEENLVIKRIKPDTIIIRRVLC